MGQFRFLFPLSPKGTNCVVTAAIATAIYLAQPLHRVPLLLLLLFLLLLSLLLPLLLPLLLRLRS